MKREIQIKSIVTVITLCLQNSINSSRYNCTQFYLTTDLLLPILPSFHVIPDRLDNVEIWDLWWLNHHFYDSLSFSILNTVHNGFVCIFGVIVLLKN